MNDALTKELKQVDKIAPGERAKLEDKFWDTVGFTPFQYSELRVRKDYWQPKRLPFPVKELDDKLKVKQFQHIPVRG